MDQALANVRVLDISSSAGGAWCTRLLADLGADVILLEPPGGHPLRSEAPFDLDGRSLVAEYFLANKRAARFDFEADDCAGRLAALAKPVDVVVTSLRPSEAGRLGLSYAAFGNASLVVAHITPYGISGKRADTPGNELTVAALSGWAALNGQASSSPLRPTGHQVAFCAGTVAAGCVIAALVDRDREGGAGQEVDISELDVMVSAGSPGILRGQYTGHSTPRRESADVTAGPVPVADGYFALTISRAHFWRDAMTVLGLHDLAEDPRWETSWYRQSHKDEYSGRVGEAMLGWKKADLFEELAARRVVAGPVLTMEELRSNSHLAERHFWTEADGQDFPGAPFRMSATPWRLRSRAPEPPTTEVEAK
ncbi:MAG: CoA transferase [Chloroflexi bacterium]|nr:CoA transferase [Dehalococcoidia bacterium]MCO5200213.1 CoA transferase [Chloroflexota bacterium]